MKPRPECGADARVWASMPSSRSQSGLLTIAESPELGHLGSCLEVRPVMASKRACLWSLTAGG